MSRRLLWTRLSTRIRYLDLAGNRRRVLAGLGVLIGLGVVWIGITGYLAKQQTSDLNTRIQQVQALVAVGDVDQAERLAKDIPAMAQRAHRLTTGPAWWVADHVPVLGEPITVAREVAAINDRIGSDAVPTLVRAANDVNPDALRASGSTIRVAPLVRARPALVHAAAVLDAAERTLRTTPGDTWLGAVNTRRNELVQQLGVVRGYVDAAARVTQVLPTLLGGTTRQHYFIGLQNESELRGTGGLPGAFTIATTYRGTISFSKFYSDVILLPPKSGQRVPTGLDFGAGYDAAYGPSKPTSSYVNSNVSPDFPYAARIWAAMWQKVSGQQVDGVLAVDPTALEYFLNAVGPAALPGGQLLTGANVVSLTQKDQYAIFPDNTERKKFVVEVLKASATQLTSGTGTALGILSAASKAATENRLLVWSRDPAIQRVLVQSNFAGTITEKSRPLGAVILNNSAAGKLDYYLDRTMTYSRTGCGSERDVNVTITLKNNAPAIGLPLYVTTRLDKAPALSRPGDYSTLLDYYATRGAELRSITLNGKQATATELSASGHPIFRLMLQLPRGATQTVVLHLAEPAGKGSPKLWRQPGVVPIRIDDFDQTCS